MSCSPWLVDQFDWYSFNQIFFLDSRKSLGEYGFKNELLLGEIIRRAIEYLHSILLISLSLNLIDSYMLTDKCLQVSK